MDQHSEKTDQRPATRSEPETSPVRATGGNDWQAILQLTVIATVGSTFIALYVLWIGMSGHHKHNVDTAAQAALYAAEQLSQIHVDSASFGKVGLCDEAADASGTFNYSPGQARVTGLNTIYKTLAVDTAIAKHLKRKVMLDLIEKDRAQAKLVEKELSMRLHEAAEPDQMEAQSSDTASQLYANTNTKPNNVYRDVYRMLAADKSAQDLSLIEVRLKLGRYRLPTAPPDAWPTGKIRLIDPPEQFEPAKNGQAPYAVLVEAVFQTKPKDNSDQIKTVSKKHCALIAAPQQAPANSTLVMNFPDGLPPVFDCAMALLNTPGLSSGNGDWQQVVGHEVPGRGSLAPSLQPVLPGMSASDAFSVILYHWLKRQGPSVNEQQLYALLNAKWNSSSSLMKYQREPVNGEEGNATPNSCLAIDTGARQYAILNQTGPGGIGQTALSRAFNIYSGALSSSPQTNFPQNALPLFVDQDGKCNLSGRHDYNDKFVNDFLKAVYDTNIAAIESSAVSRMVIARTSAELTQLEQKIYIEKQELNSVINRLNRSGLEKPEGKDGVLSIEVARQNQLIKEKIDALNAVIASDEEKRSALRSTNRLALQTTRTANQVGSSTYELCAHSFKVCKDGIYKIDKPYSAYLISKKFIFTPHTKPVDESDFFKPYAEVSDASKPWLVKGFDVVTPIENGPAKPETLIVEGKSFAEFAAANSLQRANTKVVFLTTAELFSTNTPRPMVFNFYPFGNIRIPSGQLFYYCKDAMKTGAAPSVSWSVVIRDLVASVGQNSQGFPTGDPIASDQLDWCKVSDQHDCPGLACEFQLRTPLPVITNSPETSLTNPVNNAQIQQMPPVPADML